MAFIGHHSTLGPVSERRRTFLESVHHCSPSADTKVFAGPDGPDGLDGGRQAAREVLESGFCPTAILCVNDYDLIARPWPDFDRQGFGRLFREGVNRILAAHCVAWELEEDGKICRVLPAAAQAEVTDAFTELNALQYEPALALFNAARQAYDDRPRRDRDACTNIFDALESVAKIKYNKPNDTFGRVKNHIEQNNLLRPEVVSIFTALNNLRNQNFGHGMTVHFRLSRAEVDFTYLACIGAILLLTRTP